MWLAFPACWLRTVLKASCSMLMCVPCISVAIFRCQQLYHRWKPAPLFLQGGNSQPWRCTHLCPPSCCSCILPTVSLCWAFIAQCDGVRRCSGGIACSWLLLLKQAVMTEAISLPCLLTRVPAQRSHGLLPCDVVSHGLSRWWLEASDL